MFSFGKHGKNNIQQLLTFYFILLMTVMLVAVTLVFSSIQYRNLRAGAISTLRSYCSAIAENVDLQISQMNTISLSSINSADLRETLESFVETEGDAYQHNLVRLRLGSILTSLKGFDYSIRQLNIYAMNGSGYGVGNYNGELPSCLEEEWYQEAIERNGHLYIDASSLDPLSAGSNVVSAYQPMFTLYRMFFDEYHTPIGIIAVKKYYRSVFEAARESSGYNDAEVFIYDANGVLIYPQTDEDSEEIFDYYANLGTGEGTIKNTVTGHREFFCSVALPGSGFTAVTAIRRSAFMAPVYKSLGWTFAAFLLIFLLCLILAGYLSRSITTPMRRMHAFLSDESKEAFRTLDMPDTNIQEIDFLRDALNDSIRAHEKDAKAMITLNEQEVQAQMLALQSQMNPHFLYNSLASVAEMAREGLTDQVERMTINISQILRYISSNRDQVTSLEEELELCDMYLDCMKLRFGDNLEYRFDVEDTMLDYKIPKLCVQLLIENAIKSVTTQAPPWKIIVTGYSEVVDGDARWYVRVEDNGPGFDPEVDKHLRSQMDDIIRTRTLPSLKIEGMGILNIFIRFYLLDGITFIFDFGNCPDGGAFIMVGRHIHDSDQSL